MLEISCASSRIPKDEIVSIVSRSQVKVRDLLEVHRAVMVGDGLNNLYALRATDLGILTVQQDTRTTLKLLKAADEIITNIKELPKILIKSCGG